jgi:hypothetical protein
MGKIVLLSAILVALASHYAQAWPYGTTPVRGVNVGSWLLLEKWITPQVFQGKFELNEMNKYKHFLI